MVTRPVFIPEKSRVGVRVILSPPFAWHPGFSMVQKKKNVAALHNAITQMDECLHPLEISSRSDECLGIRLSAFNLGVESNGRFFSVESVYQASKVFSNGTGPFPELYAANPAEVRKLVKEHEASPLKMYKYGNDVWELNPTRSFYDWIYCRALSKNPNLVEGLSEYNCFTDIAFNPVKAVNCQAYAVAFYLSLVNNGVEEEALANKESFLRYHPTDVVLLLKSNSSTDSRHTTRRTISANSNAPSLFDIGET
jgi:hypothetical protein